MGFMFVLMRNKRLELILVDLEFEADTFKAEQSDNINDTVNYLSVYQTIKRGFEEPSHLLEHIAKKIGDTLLKEYPQMEYC
jgi:dihydroneopterin aldolase